ncbi:FKBP-type peptidyl-prolyl cis-trans isomerase [Pseudoclavibacter soli]|uniref:FKBP-type peptidyl-prolyl cis-trans isomerase n=1 Tax=Pseudoclavibacter soli TaxID=452623 RepID=UPI00146F4EF9|nr:FKBP-type peptidyl-prolyl cis-trans isomerase [Pseudoclavibacter soli]
MHKKLAAGIMAAVAAVGLVGCSSATGAQKGVEVTGDFGTAATVSVSGDLDTSSLSSRELITGDGDTFNSDDNAEVGLTIYDPTAGSELAAYSTGYTTTTLSSYFPSLTDLLEGKTYGTRLSIVSTAADLTGEGNASTVLGMEDSDPLVTVVDLVDSVQTTDPELSDTFTDADFPTVTLDDSGTPTTTITTGVTPSTTQVKVIKEGDGDTVAAGDTVSVYYQLTRLRDGKQIETNYGDADNIYTTVADSEDSNGSIQGFVTAMVGQKVGSTVLAVIPPSEAYGSISGHTLQHEALVFVLTIDSTAAATE